MRRVKLTQENRDFLLPLINRALKTEQPHAGIVAVQFMNGEIHAVFKS